MLLFLITERPLHAQVITTIAGPGTTIYSMNSKADGVHTINNPNGVATDEEGYVYVAQYWDGVELLGGVFRFNPNQVLKGNNLRGESYPPRSGRIVYPHGITTDGAGNVYVAEYNNHTIRKISALGRVTIVAGTGQQGFSGDNGPATDARLSLVNGIATDLAGNLYITDEMNQVIRKVTPAGIISTIAGTRRQGYMGDGGPATLAQLYRPYGVAVDSAGNLYFSDAYNNVIRKINRDGIISTIAGTGKEGYSGDGGTAIAARLNKPKGIALDDWGNLYIADDVNNAIRKVDVNGMISTVAGNGTRGYKGDSSAATAAQLSNPKDVAVDGRGNIFIADFGNHVLRKVDVTMRPVMAGLQPSATGLNAGPDGVALRSRGTEMPGTPTLIKKMKLANAVPVPAVAAPVFIQPPQRLVAIPALVVTVPEASLSKALITAPVVRIHISKAQESMQPRVAIDAAITSVWADIAQSQLQAQRDDEDKITLSISDDNVMTIHSDKGSYTSFTITNMKGEQVMDKPMKGKQTDVDVKNLENGQYSISLKGGKDVKTLRFVKEN